MCYLDTILSDHLPVFMVQKKVREKTEFKFIFRRSYRNYVKEDFQNDIRYHKALGEFWNIKGDPEKIMGDLRKNNSRITDFHCPTKHMKIQNNSPSWLNREIIEELYLKDDLYKRASFSGREEDYKINELKN